MSMIYKAKGDKSDIRNYRPITVTPVIYRLVMQIIKNRLEEWVDCEGILGELQNGFRKQRRLKDNIFSLTQCIEIAQKENRQLWLAFLDIKGAYDNVNQKTLWDIVESLNLDEGLTAILRNIYKDNKVIITWEGKATGKIEIGRGLRQGGPLSPLLFMLYLRGLEDRLEKSGLGFDLSYSKLGQTIQQSLPGLIYADNIVLMANNRIDLQELMSICGREGEELGLEFSSEKSAVMIFNNDDVERLKIQNITVERATKYKYLGVWICGGAEYLSEHEKYIIGKGNRNAAVMKNRALWNYNRYEVVREIWKGVMVPGLTFGNAVLCMKSEVHARLEIKQRGVGRLALGAHCKTPNQGVQGDMGWASFEGREAVSKIEFEDRLRQMGGEQWARKVFSYLYMRSIDTKWRQRTRKLRGKFLGYSGVTEEQVSVKKKVKATERDRWLEGMQTKKALEGYRLNKTVIAKESIYDNSRGSSLLFEARTGVLRTRTYRAKYQEMDTVCAACGEEDETAEHLILYCKGLHPMHTEDNIDLIRSLGFRDSEGKVDFKTVEITKQRLSEWWQKAREN